MGSTDFSVSYRRNQKIFFIMMIMMNNKLVPPDCGCSTGFIRVFAALGLATDLRTVEPLTIQRALADTARNDRPIQVSLAEAGNAQSLPDEHYLKRGQAPVLYILDFEFFVFCLLIKSFQATKYNNLKKIRDSTLFTRLVILLLSERCAFLARLCITISRLYIGDCLNV